MEKVHEDGNQTLGQCQRKDILRAFIFRSFLSFYLLKFFFCVWGLIHGLWKFLGSGIESVPQL